MAFLESHVAQRSDQMGEGQGHWLIWCFWPVYQQPSLPSLLGHPRYLYIVQREWDRGFVTLTYKMVQKADVTELDEVFDSPFSHSTVALKLHISVGKRAVTTIDTPLESLFSAVLIYNKALKQQETHMGTCSRVCRKAELARMLFCYAAQHDQIFKLLPTRKVVGLPYISLCSYSCCQYFWLMLCMV